MYLSLKEGYIWKNSGNSYDLTLECEITEKPKIEVLEPTCDDAIYDGEGDAISRSELDALAEQGVFIHGELTNEGDYTIYTCQGCEETTYCDEDELIFCTNPIYGTGKNRKKVIGCGGHTEVIYHGESMDGAPDDECTNYTEEKHCPGHTVKVCYGHKDIKINIPTYFMKYAFEEMSLKYYINRLGFLTSCATDLFGWDEDAIDWCQALYDEPTWLKNYGIIYQLTDWRYLV